MCKILAVGSALLALAVSAVPAHAGPSGNVMPPAARPLGWSLNDMAAPVGIFNENWNDMAFYPDTPFQVLFSPGPDTWTIRTGTWLYVPVLYQDDAPAWVWPDEPVPSTQAEAAFNFFDAGQQGVHDVRIVVDGKQTTLGPEYTTAPMSFPYPVLSLTTGQLAHSIFYVGAFLSPLDKGTHSITIGFKVDGPLLLYISTLQGWPTTSWEWSATYTVIVK